MKTPLSGRRTCKFVLLVAGIFILKKSKFYVIVVPMLLKHLDFLFSFGLQRGRNTVATKA